MADGGGAPARILTGGVIWLACFMSVYECVCAWFVYCVCVCVCGVLCDTHMNMHIEVHIFLALSPCQSHETPLGCDTSLNCFY